MDDLEQLDTEVLRRMAGRNGLSPEGERVCLLRRLRENFKDSQSRSSAPPRKPGPPGPAPPDSPGPPGAPPPGRPGTLGALPPGRTGTSRPPGSKSAGPPFRSAPTPTPSAPSGRGAPSRPRPSSSRQGNFFH